MPSTQITQTQSVVLNVREAAAYFGVSADALYRYAKDGAVPAFRLGNRWLFKQDLLDRWIKEESLRGVMRRL